MRRANTIVGPAVLGPPYARAMNPDFWGLVAKIDRAQIGETKDDEAALAPLVTALAALPRARIEAFEDDLAAALFALDGKTYAEAAGESGQSDDGFLYARCWVVAQGREHYASVLAEPSLMPRDVDAWFEPLLDAARAAWEEKTGAEWDHTPPHDWETGSNSAAW